MSGKFPSVASDFRGVLAFFCSNGMLPSEPDKRTLAAAQRIHRATYSLLLWRFRLRDLQECGSVFVQELASDALQILPLALLGYNKAAGLLNRGLIENALRHIYFSDHPVEFLRMQSDKKWYLTASELRDYAASHPAFIDPEHKFDAVARLTRLYGELSEKVHGGRVANLEMRIALRKISPTNATLDLHAKFVEQATESINFLLSIFHRLQFARFQLEDRRIILRTLPAKARRVLAMSD